MVRWVFVYYSMMPSDMGLQHTCPGLAWIILCPLLSSLCGMSMPCSCLILNSWNSWVIHPAFSCCDSMLWVFSLLLSTLPLALLFSFIAVLQFISRCTYRPWDSLQWFFGSVPQKLTSVHVLVFVGLSLSYCSTVTGVCIMCFIFHMIILPLFSLACSMITLGGLCCCLKWSHHVSRDLHSPSRPLL